MLPFVALHTVAPRIIGLCSRVIDMIYRPCRLCYTAVQSVMHRLARGILSHQHHSALPVDPWITQTVFSDRLAAVALSWLGLSAETTDIYYAVLYGLGDAVRGVTVADYLAPPLQMRISVQTSDIAFGRVSGDFQVVMTHLRAAYHLQNLLPLRDVSAWISEQVRSFEISRTKLRTQRDYDTLLRISTIPEKHYAWTQLTRFFGDEAGQRVGKSPFAILPSTATIIAQLYILYIQARTTGGDTYFRSCALAMLNALRSHLVVSPDLVAKLLKSSFADEEGAIKAEGSLRVKPPHDCGSASCEAMIYLVAILARHDFEYSSWGMKTEVRNRLKAKTFETFALFCRKFPISESCPGLRSSLTFWLSRDDPFSQISLCGRDIASFLPLCQSLSRDTRIRMIRQLLHPNQSWCAPDSSDLGRDEGLDVCLRSVLSFDDIYKYLILPEPRLGIFGLSELRILLDDAHLEPLHRAPRWTHSSVLGMCAEALASTDDDGSDVERLVSKFIFCEVRSGPNTRTWDLVIAGSQTILGIAEMAYAPHLRELCEALGKLRRRYPHKAHWKDMGERVKQGAGFLNDSTWRARTNPDRAVETRSILEDFCRVMDTEESLPGGRSQGPQVASTSRLMDEGPEIEGDTAHKLLEWQIDGAY